MADLVRVVASGDRRAALEAIRDRLAVEMDSEDAGPRDVAAVAKQLQDVIRELDQLPSGEEASPVDDLANARAARRAAAQASTDTPSGDQRRSGSGRARGKRGSGT